MSAEAQVALIVGIIAAVAVLLGAAIGLFGSLRVWKLQRAAEKADRVDATLRAAYVTVLQAAGVSIDGIQELKWFPAGRPHIERSEVVGGGVVQSEPQYLPIPRPNGDYTRVTQLLEEAQRLKSEATIDLGVEHETDPCLEFFDVHFDQVFWGNYDVMVGGSGYTPDLDTTLTEMRNNQK